MADADDNFLSRWSQRKQAKRQGVELVEPVVLPSPASNELLKRKQPLAGIETNLNAPNSGVTEEQQAIEEDKPPAPTLQDAQLLTPESDFKPFMRADVQPEVKNAAMKQLFKDPHFNVMDMMDIYVDDYSKPDPLPPEMLRQMAVTQFLGFWEETEEEKAAKAAKAQADLARNTAEPTREDAESEVAKTVAQSELVENSPSQDTGAQPLQVSHTDDHPDLQLQPNDAAGREGAQPASG
jgi:Protein of unknown function (DUF3306)